MRSVLYYLVLVFWNAKRKYFSMTKIRIDKEKGGSIFQLHLGCDAAEDAVARAMGEADNALGKIHNEEMYLRPRGTGAANCADCGACFRANVAPSGKPTQMSSALIDPWSEEGEHLVTVYTGWPEATSVVVPGDFRRVCLRHKEG